MEPNHSFHRWDLQHITHRGIGTANRLPDRESTCRSSNQADESSIDCSALTDIFNAIHTDIFNAMRDTRWG